MPAADADELGLLSHPALHERRPRLEDDAVLSAELDERRLLKPGVPLDLVHRGCDPGPGEQDLELGDEEVADADGPRPSLGQQVLQDPPGLDVRAGDGPVHEVQIDSVEAELLQAELEGLPHPALAQVVVPDLGGDEDLVPGDARGAQGPAHVRFVPVERGGVDVAVAELECPGDGLLRLAARGRLPGANAEPRHRNAVVQERAVGDGEGHGHLVPRRAARDNSGGFSLRSGCIAGRARPREGLAASCARAAISVDSRDTEGERRGHE